MARSERRDLAKLGRSLRRVRVAERAIEGGGKKVWHQGEEGVEVLSFVDAAGHVTRQECYLGSRMAIWRADGSLVTGSVAQESRRPGVSASEVLVPDGEPEAEVARQVLGVLEGHSGDDRYLRHLRVAIEAALIGLGEELSAEVTSAQVPPPVPHPVQRAPKRKAPWIWIALALGAIALAGYALTRLGGA